ncbi:MAG: DeoR/GlpR family DNA-binding transcription regulator [Lachnospiraceae bacterium]|nr:DeoR/GlpR family DNA-binding transcription regulator [Lachnospiraceae bacterium]
METRRDAIVSLINEKGNVNFQELKKHFPQVSEMTLRTDLKVLDEEKRIIRIHGGAKAVNQVFGTDDLFGRRIARNTVLKQKIAEKAASLIKPNSTIYLDSGSTTTMLAKIIPDQPQMIYTTGLSCAQELARHEQTGIYIPGGEMNRYSMSVCGIEAIEELQRVNFDIAFIGVTCYDKETGFTCNASDEARLKRAAMKNTGLKVVLLDSSKVDLRGTFSICDLKDIDIIITDDLISADFLDDAADAGVTIM